MRLQISFLIVKKHPSKPIMAYLNCSLLIKLRSNAKFAYNALAPIKGVEILGFLVYKMKHYRLHLSRI